jgi:hypothetical protein
MRRRSSGGNTKIPDVTIVLISLYVVGGALELAGILAVVAEMHADRTRAVEVAEISLPTVGHASQAMNFPRAPAWTIRGAIEREDASRPQRLQAEANQRLKHALVDILTGNQRLRVLGVGLLVAGVLVSTAANVVAT